MASMALNQLPMAEELHGKMRAKNQGGLTLEIRLRVPPGAER